MLMPIVTAVFLALLEAQAPGRAARQPRKANTQPADALAVQVMLDRAGFSPGVIDGRQGGNTRKAFEQFQKQGNHPDAAATEAVTRYRLTADDAAGPFVAIPSEMIDKSKLPALGYESALEMLAERFHCTPDLLRRLNPGAKFAADEEIAVPNVEAMVLPAVAPTAAERKDPEQAKAATAARVERAARADIVVTVAKHASALTVTDPDGRVLFYAPVTTGSEHDPLPIGEWKVRGVQFNPTFHYNPDLFWDADPSQAKATIPAGPNNPVGPVWIDLTKEHYGLHGTPEPSTIGKTQSHGCVRLTNWDALKLAAIVKPGTRVVFAE